VNPLETAAKSLLITGGVLLLLGGLVWLLSKIPFSVRLPGDIRIERAGFTCLIPVASSVILSILLTIVLNIALRVINR
jgi:hypothetical protein